jgi:2-isopropylmalate synthase
MTTAPTEDAVLTLVRWTVTSGSNSQSRGAVVLTSADHQWEASAQADGPIDALYHAVDRATDAILSGHPRLLAFDIHALTEGTDAEAEVVVRIAPPADAEGDRSVGEWVGRGRSTNIVAASIQAYIDALNQLLGEAAWAGATEAAGNRRWMAGGSPERREVELDETIVEEPTAWFER